MTYTEFKAKYKLSLNPQQDAAVQAVDGPILLLAVPGSGKTTVLVARLGYMLFCCGIMPEEILTTTYTVSATADMKSRFASLFGDDTASRMAFHTINGVSARIIRYYERTQDRRAFELMTDEGRLSSIISEIYREKTNSFAAESDIKAIRTNITYVKNMLLSDDEIEKLEMEGVDFAPIYHEYCLQLKSRGLMDYDDQMVYAYQILRRCPDILEHFQSRYRYFCVDEAQDTSKIQHFIIRLLSQRKGNLFMVGDEDQSIYGFRAAYPEALMEFEKVHFGAKVLLMERNYRSTGHIVSVSDKFISRNRSRQPKHMTAQRGDGNAIKELSVYDRRGQYAYLARLAKDCKTETAVLYRDNDSALPLIDLLDREGTPYRCRQIDSAFFSHRIVRDITDIIRFARDPSDGETFMRIYYKLGAGISKAAAEKASEQSRRHGDPVLELLLETPGLSAWTQKQCKALQTHLTNLLGETADKAVYRITHFMGYGNYLEERGADSGKAQILEALGAQEATPERLLERLDELSEIIKTGSSDLDCKFILSTIHSSKGLEYERVILMDVADGILPKTVIANESAATPEELSSYEEERRLFYVGMTRAKNELSIFRFKHPELSSVFVDSVFPEKVTQTKSTTPAKPATTVLRPPAQSQDNIWEAKDYIPGTKVLHKRFGTGKLSSKQGDIVTVSFDDGAEKRFSLSVALRQNQLTRAGKSIK